MWWRRYSTIVVPQLCVGAVCASGSGLAGGRPFDVGSGRCDPREQDVGCKALTPVVLIALGGLHEIGISTQFGSGHGPNTGRVAEGVWG